MLDVVHYTFEIIMSFCSIHFGVVQSSKGYTAAARFAYQTCSVADDRFRHVDYRCYAPYRVGGGVLLPMGAPTELAEWQNFLGAAVSRETRRNGQEGRILDFALPRAVPRELLLPGLGPLPQRLPECGWPAPVNHKRCPPPLAACACRQRQTPAPARSHPR